MDYNDDFKTAISEYSKSKKFKKLMEANDSETPGSIIINDKQAALKMKEMLKDMYTRGRNDQANTI
jgi:predicted HAD superfamily Cof-like phosphohydrolase